MGGTKPLVVAAATHHMPNQSSCFRALSQKPPSKGDNGLVSETTLLNLGLNTWILLAVFLALAALVWWVALERKPLQMVVAGLRAMVQLALVALLIAGLSHNPQLALAFLALMFVVATWTSGHRVAPTGSWWLAAVPLAVGVIPTVGLMLIFAVLPWSALALIAVIGQQIGGAMSTVTLSGRRIRDELEQRNGEVEAAVALGFLWPAARSLVAKTVAGEAVIPTLDQTRTAGLVTLPGAFVGMIIGGASPVDAGVIQLLVLVSLLLTTSLASTTTLWISCRGMWARPSASQSA